MWKFLSIILVVCFASGCATNMHQQKPEETYTLAQKNARLVCSGDYHIENGKLTDRYSNFLNQALSQNVVSESIVDRFADHMTCLIFAEKALAEHKQEVSPEEAKDMKRYIYLLMMHAKYFDQNKENKIEII